MTREFCDYVKAAERWQRILRRRNIFLVIAMYVIVVAVLFL